MKVKKGAPSTEKDQKEQRETALSQAEFEAYMNSMCKVLEMKKQMVQKGKKLP